MTSKTGLAVERDCTSQCRSKVHAAQCVAAATLRGVTDRQLASYLFHLCSNFAKKQDETGRTVLQVAASCGKTELCQWLVTCAGSVPNARDIESGYTALHRAVYYGHLDTAVRLLQFGAHLEVCDNEDMTVLDILCKERSVRENSPAQDIPSVQICQPYVWGVNKNYSLGTGSDNTRKTPELLEFTKHSVSIKQVALEELHSVYVSSSGKAWSCGMGQGGRLGTGSNNSSLTPQPIKTHDHGVLSAAVALNHTLLLLNNNTVLSFGGNREHQLGVFPHVPECLSPRQVYQGNFSGAHPLLGVLAAKYHSVFYSDSAVYACGLNGGQLGRSSTAQSPYITQPLKIPLSLNGRTITNVATSMGAIVVAVSNGDIYIVNRFQCKKMTSKLLDVVKIACIGGSLEHSGEGGPTSDAGSTELRVVVLNSRGSLLLWKESVQHPTRCIFGTKQSINVADFCLTQQHVLLVTKDGTAFQGAFTTTPHTNVLSGGERSSGTSIAGRSNQFHKFFERSECYSVRLKRLPNVFRGIAISADPRGNNYSVIQTHPKMSLTEIPIIGESDMSCQMTTLLHEASEEDPVHDAVIKVSGRVFAVHCFILSRCGGTLGEEAFREKTLILKDTNPYIVEQLLLFLYSGSCDLLKPGPFDTRKVAKKEDPVKLCIELCNRYKIPALSRKLQKLRYEGGKILVKEGFDFEAELKRDLKFDRKSGSDLYDVTIKSEDGSTVRAHKCILVARLDYFHSMFLGGWSETSRDCVLELPFPCRVLKDLIDFIYSDDVPDHLSADEDLDHIIRLLIAGDQLLIRRLKECCELVLISALTLRNAPTVLHLSSLYNSPQLKASAVQFICLNLPSFLQSRLLEVLDDDVLKELSRYYRVWSKKEYRVLTPLPGAPYEEEVTTTPLVPWPDEFSLEKKNEAAADLKSPPSSSKKKRSSKKSLSSTLEQLSLIDAEPSPVKEEEEEVSLKPTIEEVSMVSVAASPPKPAQDLAWLASQFPQLHSKYNKVKILHPPQNKSESSRRLFAAPVKLSQKERKRLSSESEKSAEPIAPVIPIVPVKPARTWATLPPLPSQQTSANELRSDVSGESAPEARKFEEIIAHDKQSKANLAKMKSKPFHLTQLEERAIAELAVFYNAANEFDERITIHRVLSSNIDRPQWITSTTAAAKH